MYEEVLIMPEKMLRVADIAKILGCSLKKAYLIVGQSDFPKIVIGREYYIPRQAYDKWVQKYTRKNYCLK